MRLLLDTHVFLWYITGDVRVDRNMREAVENADVRLLECCIRLGGNDQVRVGQAGAARAAAPVAIRATRAARVRLSLDRRSIDCASGSSA
jgi:hypothetical protein